MDKDKQQITDQWYAIKVFYNKVFQMEDILSDMHPVGVVDGYDYYDDVEE